MNSELDLKYERCQRFLANANAVHEKMERMVKQMHDLSRIVGEIVEGLPNL